MSDQKTHKLMLYNDDVHDMHYIMACLIRFCGHDPIQAEQATLIAHNNGKCSVKVGEFLDMFELQTTFNTMDIKTEVEAYESSVH